MRPIHKIVVHVSDTPDDRNLGAADIRRYHVEQGWTDIGYHYVVRKSGEVEVGRPLAKIGAHAYGHNRLSVGVCWIGRDDCNAVQRAALLKLLTSLMDAFGLEASDVVGHSELNAGKTCPNIDMDEIRAAL